MNNLSWLLYAADIIPNVGTLFFTVGILLFIMGGISLIVYSVAIHEHINRQTYRDSPDAEQKILLQGQLLEYNKVRSVVLWFGIPTSILFITLSVLTPSSKTIYLIAGSEAGETVVMSEQGQEIVGDIQQIIKLQLEGMKN